MMKPPRGLEEVISLLLSPPLASVSLLGTNLRTKVMKFLIAREKHTASQLKVPDSPFRVGWKNSCSPERNLTVGKRGVPLSLQGRQEVSGRPMRFAGPLPCDCQYLDGIASEQRLWGFWGLPLPHLQKLLWGFCSWRWEVWKRKRVRGWDGCVLAGMQKRVRHGALPL